MEVLDTSLQEVTWWGTWEILRPLFPKQVTFRAVSDPYEEMEPLDWLMKVRQSLILMENGNVGDILQRQEKPFHNHVHKKTPLMVSFANRTDENPCASYGTIFTFSKSLTSLWNVDFQCPIHGCYDSFCHLRKTQPHQWWLSALPCDPESCSKSCIILF